MTSVALWTRLKKTRLKRRGSNAHAARQAVRFAVRCARTLISASACSSASSSRTKRAVVGGFERRHSGALACGENQDVADHVVDAHDLFADALLRLRAYFRRDAGHARHFGGKADDGQRSFQVVDDAVREIADDGETFGLHDFAEMKLVEFAQAVADLLQHTEGEPGERWSNASISSRGMK